MMRFTPYGRIIIILLVTLPRTSGAQEIGPADSLRVKEWKSMAYQCLQQRLNEQAVLYYDSALKLQPADFNARFGISEALFRQGLYASALVHIDFLNQSYPGNPDVMLHRALVLCAMKRNTDAIWAINDYVRIKPEDPEGWYIKGRVQKNKVEEMPSAMGKKSSYKDAIRNLEKAISLSGGKHYNAQVVLGNIYANVKDRAKAMDYYRMAKQSDSTKGLPYVLIGQQALAMMDAALALEEFDTAMRLEPGNEQVQDMVHRNLLKLGFYGRVDLRLDSLLSLDSCSADAWMGKGLVQAYRKQYREAIACYDKAIACHPDHPDPYYMRALCWLSLKDKKKAGEDLRRAASLGHPETPLVLKSDLRYRESWMPFLSDITRYYPWWLHY